MLMSKGGTYDKKTIFEIFSCSTVRREEKKCVVRMPKIIPYDTAFNTGVSGFKTNKGHWVLAIILENYVCFSNFIFLSRIYSSLTLWRLKWIFIIDDSIRISQRTQCVCIRKTSRWLMCREIICVYFDHYAAHLHKLCGQDADILVWYLAVRIFIIMRHQLATGSFEIHVVTFP
jgi:hypothetical protein